MSMCKSHRHGCGWCVKEEDHTGSHECCGGTAGPIHEWFDAAPAAAGEST